MELQIALEVKKAFELIEKELGIPTKKLGSLINLYDEDSYKKLIEASKLWNKFYEANIIERAKMLGFNVSDT